MEKISRIAYRKSAIKDYRKVFHLFTEGCETEPRYFDMLKQQTQSTVFIHRHRSKTHPQQVLKRAQQFIIHEKPRKESEIWLVIDIDNRDKKSLEPLFNWQNQSDHFGVAISNPCFEYWLLLHFDHGNNIKNAKHCRGQLKRYLPYYEKNFLDEQKLMQSIPHAIENAKRKHQHCKGNWFVSNSTGVYLLVERIIANTENEKK